MSKPVLRLNKGLKRDEVHKNRELKTDEVPFSVEDKKGCLRGAEPLFLKNTSPFPFKRGRGIKEDGVI